MSRCLDCGEFASYGYDKSEQNPYPKKTHCIKHRKEGMINLSYSRCQECNHRNAAYRYPDQEDQKRKRYCSSHKKEGMVDIMSPKCIECGTSASYSRPHEKRVIYCGKHKKPGTINRRLHSKKLTSNFKDRSSRIDTIKKVVNLKAKTLEKYRLTIDEDYLIINNRTEDSVGKIEITTDLKDPLITDPKNLLTKDVDPFELTLAEDYIQ